MKIFVSAAEASSDLHAAEILKKWPDAQIFGVGGPALRKLQNFQCVTQSEKLRAMGFTEILTRLPLFFFTLKKLKIEILNQKPDLILVFDYPDFHHLLLKSVQALKAVKIYCIPPKIWVWRRGRLKWIHDLVDGVMVLFPMEEKLYRGAGVPVIYRGNPLMDKLPLNINKSEARRLLGLDPNQEDIFVAMPGSRPSEVKRHSKAFAKTFQNLSQKLGRKIIVLVPFPDVENPKPFLKFFNNSDQVEFRVSQGNAHLCLRAAKYGLIKSGTSVLESVLLECNTLAVYRVSKLTEWIFRFAIRYIGPVTLPNILLGIQHRKNGIIRELLGPEATIEAMTQGLLELMRNSEKNRYAQQELRKSLGAPGEVTQNILNSLMEWSKTPPERSRLAMHSFSWNQWLVSLVWSTLNAAIRFFRESLVEKHFLGRPTLVVGNIQAGGAGKSPVVREISKSAIQKGLRIAMLSRGYGRSSAESIMVSPFEAISVSRIGDEASDFHRQVPQAWIGVGSNRLRLAEKILDVSRGAIDLFILDDGFQSQHLENATHLVCVTSRKRGEVVFRDFQSALKYADFIIQTDNCRGIRNPPQKPVVALLAVADPIGVVRNWRNAGINVRDWVTLGDHAEITDDIFLKAREVAKNCKAILAMTTKDAVKVASLPETDKNSTQFIVIEDSWAFPEGFIDQVWKKVF